ncbi:MAG: hypothetical protein QOH96_461, partial [Blastocatellia bacterium]|nr:hypothetical protein [Blastocatellia bacterium]
YGEYRDVGEIKVAFSARVELPGGSLIMKLKEVKNNVTLDDAMFHMPESK